MVKRKKPDGNLFAPDRGEFGIGPFFKDRHRKNFTVRPLVMRDLIEQDLVPRPPGLEHFGDEAWRTLVLISLRLSIEGIPDGEITPEFILDMDPDDRFDIDEAIERQVTRLAPFRSGSFGRAVKQQAREFKEEQQAEARRIKDRLEKAARRGGKGGEADDPDPDGEGDEPGGGAGDDGGGGGEVDRGPERAEPHEE